ncbi:MAG: M15 family metallopeptidase [Clostridia bacterium]|nr:M15 family metallopeptidase [Clostridia bacterium]
MKKLLCAVLAAVMMLSVILPVLAEDSEVEWEEIFEEVADDSAPSAHGDEVPWTFPVALEDMDPTLIVLANKHMLIDKDYVSGELVTMKRRKEAADGSNANGGVRKASSSEMQLEKRCGTALVEMFEAAAEDGIKLYLKSAYRSYRTQKTMYYNRLEKNGGKDDGWVAKPGTSDHQTGLGCDIVSYAWCDKAMNEKFAQTKEAQWMAEHCHEYGFILRYPEDKTEVTEINFEPWHMRYVGIPAATYIMENGLCLEEFYEELQLAIDEYLAAGGDPEKVNKFIQVSAE